MALRTRARLVAVAAVALLAPLGSGAAAGATPADPVDAVVPAPADFDGALSALSGVAQDRFPATFAGLWPAGDGRTVNVAFSSDAAGSAAALASVAGTAAAVRPVTVARSLADLHSAQTRLVADRESARAGRLAFPGVDKAAYDLDIDVPGNAVVAIVPGATAATVAAFRARYGDDVVVRAGAIAAPQCTQLDCRLSLRAGLRTVGTGTCSTAFTVYRNSVRHILSAAHCGGSTRTQGGTQYGTVAAEQQSGRADAEVHTVSSNGFFPFSYVWVSSTEQARQITASTTWANTAVGNAICKSGQTTGYTCGSVTSTNYSPSYVPGSDRFIKTSYCSQPGDSGGGVFNVNTAYGIHSGGAADANGNALPCSDPNHFALFGHIEYALPATGSSILVTEPATAWDSIAAKHGTTTVTGKWSKPLTCSTISSGDFTATVNSVAVSVTATSCASYTSNSTVTITLGTTLVANTTVALTIVGTINDGVGRAICKCTKSATVTL